MTWTLIELQEAVILLGRGTARPCVVFLQGATTIVESVLTRLITRLRDLDTLELLTQSVAAIDLEQVLQLHALVHV